MEQPRLVREPERKHITGVGKRSWDYLESKGEAPKRIKFNGYNNCWLEAELIGWVQEKVAQRDSA